MNNTCTCAPELKEKEKQDGIKELKEFIKEHKLLHDKQGALMTVLHKVQEIFGYIPREAMDVVSESLGVPTAHIYGMATFYNFFSLKPKAKYQISVCKGTACYVAGGSRLLERVEEELKIKLGDVTPDGLFGLSITRCLGCCGLSPVIQVNEEVFVRLVPEKIPAILEKFRKQEKKTK